eukprot:TRINITY_DN5474_c0_g1_i1.p1 TRINITY_DN5474_c0_g1~~TRINITY_DN5474_c0_g1_i1.p1  ORF type:complete len:183 (-),score=43.44 TRINITY_DN5474_c0_g1_i1:648-1196(-)
MGKYNIRIKLKLRKSKGRPRYFIIKDTDTFNETLQRIKTVMGVDPDKQYELCSIDRILYDDIEQFRENDIVYLDPVVEYVVHTDDGDIRVSTLDEALHYSKEEGFSLTRQSPDIELDENGEDIQKFCLFDKSGMLAGVFSSKEDAAAYAKSHKEQGPYKLESPESIRPEIKNNFHQLSPRLT